MSKGCNRSFVYILIIALVGLIFVAYGANQYYETRESAAREQEIQDVHDNLDSLIQRYRDALRIVESLGVFQNKENMQVSSEAQAAMDTLRKYIDAVSLFAMDDQGTQIIGSGAVSKGVSYRYRTYFQKAIQGTSYVYPGIGTNYKTLRLFFSEPHYSDKSKSPVGILGLSVEAEKIDELLRPRTAATILGLITEDGIVFASSFREILYKSVLPISPQRLNEIDSSRQFGTISISPANFLISSRKILLNHSEYYVSREKLKNTNIELFSLQPAKKREYAAFIGIVVFVYLLIVYLSVRLAMSLKRINEQKKILAAVNAELIENQRILEHQATHDYLTNLPNRRAALEHLSKELSRCRRMGEKMAIGIGDIDHFKNINDTWGHPAGDAVLRLIADAFRHEVREYDYVARIGGEEFLLILPFNRVFLAVG